MSFLDAIFDDPVIGAHKTITHTSGGVSQDINVILEYKDRAILDNQGDQVQSRARFFAREQVSAGDTVTIDGQSFYILRVDRPMLEGEVSHSEAYL